MKGQLPLSVEGLSSEGVEQFGRSTALFPGLNYHLRKICDRAFESRDRFARHFTQIVRQRLGVKANEALRTSFEHVEHHDVFEVTVRASSEPVFLKTKGADEEFYVRTGPQTVRLSVREAMEYAGEHFR
jgi:hypothetical protein